MRFVLLCVFFAVVASTAAAVAIVPVNVVPESQPQYDVEVQGHENVGVRSARQFGYGGYHDHGHHHHDHYHDYHDHDYHHHHDDYHDHHGHFDHHHGHHHHHHPHGGFGGLGGGFGAFGNYGIGFGGGLFG